MIHLKPKEHLFITNALHKYLPNVKVFAFGSRVRGDHHPYSDLDLAIEVNMKHMDIGKSIANLEVMLKESDLPFTVDIIRLDKVDEAFKDHILKTSESWVFN